ncbi:MAG: hypothetical protein GXO00_01770 [Candidatus Diapherotrites archaeon]|nr:hypothetical protein [Candidatus Diapherotrites archaeon]
MVTALKEGKDPVEEALKHADPNTVAFSFVGTRSEPKRSSTLPTTTRGLLAKVFAEAIGRGSGHLKDRYGIPLSDLVHLYYFIRAHGVPHLVREDIFDDTIKADRPYIRIKDLLMRAHNYNDYEVFLLFLALRDAYKKLNERVDEVAEKTP